MKTLLDEVREAKQDMLKELLRSDKPTDADDYLAAVEKFQDIIHRHLQPLTTEQVVEWMLTNGGEDFPLGTTVRVNDYQITITANGISFNKWDGDRLRDGIRNLPLPCFRSLPHFVDFIHTLTGSTQR